MVLLVAGKINANGRILYWKNILPIIVGNYAIVENGNGIDLIEVVGNIVTTKENVSYFSNTKYENMKEVIKIIPKEELPIKF